MAKLLCRIKGSRAPLRDTCKGVIHVECPGDLDTYPGLEEPQTSQREEKRHMDFGESTRLETY